jgi:predicted O-methyltransferase YrrM
MNKECKDLLEKIDISKGYDSVVDWVKNTAGSSNKDYFKCNTSGGLRLQQVPEEYSNVMIEIYSKKPKSYLEIGIGNGGSWMTFSYVNRESLEKSHAVDNLSYYQAIGQKIEEIDYVKSFLSENIKEVNFFNSNSYEYLKDCKEKYDVIFIDGDHGYEGVKSDYINCIPLINEGGIMIFHDINSKGAPGVVKFWNEYKKNHSNKEFVFSDTCGMGIFYF